MHNSHETMSTSNDVGANFLVTSVVHVTMSLIINLFIVLIFILFFGTISFKSTTKETQNTAFCAHYIVT